MNPRQDSLYDRWLTETHKPHLQRLHCLERERRRQRAVTPTWQFATSYPVQPPPRYPFQQPFQALTPLSTIDPKVK